MREIGYVPAVGGLIDGKVVQRRQTKGNLLRLLLDGEWQVFRLVPRAAAAPTPATETNPDPRVGQWFRLTWNTAVWRVEAVEGDYVICRSWLSIREGRDWQARVHKSRLIPLPEVCPLLQGLNVSADTPDSRNS